MDVIELRKRMGMVFQKSNPFPKSIYENVAYGLRIQGIRDRAVLDEAVERSLTRRACGTRSRTGSTRAAWACPAASSSACASPGPWPSSRRCC